MGAATAPYTPADDEDDTSAAARAARDVGSTATDAGRQTAAAAADETRQVAQVAAEGAKQVAGEAKAQVAQVAHVASKQVRNLASQAQDQLRAQAETQTQRAAESLRRLGDQARALAEGRSEEAGPVGDYVSRFAERVSDAASRLESGGIHGLVNDVQDFARRRPVAFLAAAAVAGFAVSRVGRAQSADGDGSSASHREPLAQLLPAVTAPVAAGPTSIGYGDVPPGTGIGTGQAGVGFDATAEVAPDPGGAFGDLTPAVPGPLDPLPGDVGRGLSPTGASAMEDMESGTTAHGTLGSDNEAEPGDEGLEGDPESRGL